MGIGSFKIGPPNSRICCPQCDQKLPNIPITCAFNNCKWKYDGVMIVNGRDTKRVSSDWKVVGDQYYRFKESNTANWAELILHIAINTNGSGLGDSINAHFETEGLDSLSEYIQKNFNFQ
jgi:hypothetical protein